MSTNPLQEAVADYLAEKTHRKSFATADQYRLILEGILLPWCESQDITKPAQMTDKAMDRFTDYLRERRHRGKPLSIHTIRTYVKGVRLFLNWREVARGRYEPPKAPHRLLEVLTLAEIEAMERAAIDPRDRVIVRVLADTGIRVSELLGLRVSDLHQNTHDRRYSIRVIGKGDEEREVPVPPKTFELLKRYAAFAPLNRFAHEGGGLPSDDEFEGGYIFIGKRRRHGGAVERLTPSGLAQLIKNLARQAGIKRRVWPHLFRHSYGTWMLSNYMNPVTLQKIMGHKDLSMISEVYSHLVIADTYAAMERALSVNA